MCREFVYATAAFCCISAIFSAAAGSAFAQTSKGSRLELKIPDSAHVQILTTRHGSTLIGRIVEIGELEIQFETDLGRIPVSIAAIEDIEEVPASSFRSGKYWFPNPNVTRLYFAPTGRMLKRGSGYFYDVYLFFPGFTYAVTDNVTVGGGMSLIPDVDIEDQVFYLTPKVGVTAAKDLNLAVGALLINVPDFDDDGDSEVVGILYGVGTVGSPGASLTAGLGYGFAGGDIADKPAIMIGGEGRLMRRVSFVTENWIFPEVDNPLVSYGFRFFGQALSVDLALVNVLSDDAIFPGIPYIDFAYYF